MRFSTILNRFVSTALVCLCLSGIAGADEPAEEIRVSKEAATDLFSISPTGNDEKIDKVAQGHREMLSRVTPGVVSVFPARLAINQDLGGSAIERFYGRSQGEDGYRAEGTGSGVIISPDGWIVTNNHVIEMVSGEAADTIVVELEDGMRYEANLVGVDKRTDLALLKIDAGELTPVLIGDSDNVATGDLVFAIGNPFSLGTTATMGMVSALGRSNLLTKDPQAVESFIQTDAAINPGNSGGALVDLNGRLVGINTSIYTGKGGGNLGIGFAIPTRLMRYVVAQLAQHGEVQRGYFGISLSAVSGNPVATGKGASVRGAEVSDVMQDGPGQIANLEKGDIIVKVGNRETRYVNDVRTELAYFKQGDTAEVVIVRKGKEMFLSMVAVRFPDGKSEMGFSISQLPQVEFRAVEGSVDVLKVGSYKPETGDWFQKGMKVIEVNKVKVGTGKEMEESFIEGVNRVIVEFGRRKQTLAIRIEGK